MVTTCSVSTNVAVDLGPELGDLVVIIVLVWYSLSLRSRVLVFVSIWKNRLIIVVIRVNRMHEKLTVHKLAIG